MNRCDKCQARAYVTIMTAEGALAFCMHHARQHGEKLRQYPASAEGLCADKTWWDYFLRRAAVPS